MLWEVSRTSRFGKTRLMGTATVAIVFCDL